MRDEPRTPARHQLDHAVPTVIHHPEEKMPVLARWVRHAMENQTRFWSLIAGLVVVVIGLGLLSNGLSLGRSASDAAWSHIETAKTPSERVEIARDYPKTQAEQWGLLQAGTEYYNQGFVDLPANRDAALPALKRALDLFDEVAREAPQDSPQARIAAFNAARTLEARNELEKARERYEKVASTWKGTPEAAEAERLAKALQQPETINFYKELYAYKPAEVTLPPGGQGGFTLPSGHPPIDGLTPPSMFPSSPMMIPPPPPSSSGAEPVPAPKADPAKVEPSLPLLPPPPSEPSTAPRAEPAPAPKAETPKDKDTPGSPLPSDPFAPERPAPKDKDQAKTPAETPKGDLPADPFAPKG